MKVSNFTHLARNPLPAFVMILDFAGKDEPQTSYLAHFGPERIAQTLRRLRELELARDFDTHKHTMTLTVETAEQVPVGDSKALRATIFRVVGNDLSKYVRNKTDLLETLGYDDAKYRLSFSSRITIADWIERFPGLEENSH